MNLRTVVDFFEKLWFSNGIPVPMKRLSKSFSNDFLLLHRHWRKCD